MPQYVINWIHYIQRFTAKNTADALQLTGICRFHWFHAHVKINNLWSNSLHGCIHHTTIITIISTSHPQYIQTADDNFNNSGFVQTLQHGFLGLLRTEKHQNPSRTETQVVHFLGLLSTTFAHIQFSQHRKQSLTTQNLVVPAEC